MTPLALLWWLRPVMSAARVGEQKAVVVKVLYPRRLSASRSKLGVCIGPPKVLLAPNPTSSVRISRTFGAPLGASTPFGKSGLESLTVRSILPPKEGSGLGRTSSAEASVAIVRNATRTRRFNIVVLHPIEEVVASQGALGGRGALAHHPRGVVDRLECRCSSPGTNVASAQRCWDLSNSPWPDGRMSHTFDRAG